MDEVGMPLSFNETTDLVSRQIVLNFLFKEQQKFIYFFICKTKIKELV